MAAFLIVLFVVGGINWYLVFNERARRRWGWSNGYFFSRNKEGKEAGDALAIATALIVAVLCSSVIVVALIAALVSLAK